MLLIISDSSEGKIKDGKTHKDCLMTEGSALQDRFILESNTLPPRNAKIRGKNFGIEKDKIL